MDVLYDESNWPRLTAAAVLTAASCCGVILPFCLRSSNTRLDRIRPLACGVIFGVVFFHLLPDATKLLNSHAVTALIISKLPFPFTPTSHDPFPLAELFLLLGAFIMIAIDQKLPCPHDHATPPSTASSSRSSSPVRPKPAVPPAESFEAAEVSTEVSTESTPFFTPLPAQPKARPKTFSFDKHSSDYTFTSNSTSSSNKRPPLPSSAPSKNSTIPPPPVLSPIHTIVPSIKRGTLCKMSKYLKNWNPRAVTFDVAGHLHWDGGSR